MIFKRQAFLQFVKSPFATFLLSGFRLYNVVLYFSCIRLNITY